MSQRQIPLALCFILGVFMMIQFFIKHPTLQGDLLNEMSNFATVVGIFAFFLGLYSITRVHWLRVRRRREGWGFSYVLFTAMVVMALFGNIWGSEAGSPFAWCFETIMVPLQATTFCLLAFYMASASFRAFRAKNFEATMLLIAAIIVMFGRVDIGAILIPDTSIGNIPIPGADELSQWLMEIPNNAATRGIALGIALGTLATSLKMILGVERSYLG